jgi:predicted dehydrogenase
MIRAAVIGVGAMGKHHARVYNDLDNVELVAVADPDESRRLAVARRYKVAAYADHQDLLKHEQPDVVSIAVPTVLHREVALSVIRRGVHLLVEKPIAFTVEEAQDIIEQAAQAGVTLAVGHVERFNPAVTELKRRLVNGELGRIFQVHARRLSPFPHYVRDVGVVIDLATHELDIMRYVVGDEIERVYAETGRNVHERYEDMLSGIIRFRNSVVGVLDINWLTPTKVRELQITGEQGMFLVDYLEQDLYFYENSEAPSRWDTMALFKGVEEGNVLKIRVSKIEPLEAELRTFVDAAANGTGPVVSGLDGLRAIALAHLLIASGEEGRVLRVKEEAERRGWGKIGGRWLGG